MDGTGSDQPEVKEDQPERISGDELLSEGENLDEGQIEGDRDES